MLDVVDEGVEFGVVAVVPGVETISVYLTGIQSTRRCVKRQQPTVLFLVHRFITALLRV